MPRPAPQVERIRRAVLDRILAGDYAPGRRLPNRQALEAEFGSGPVTVQRAIGQLAQQGFVEARRGVGTRVVDHPPHLVRYGLVFPTHPGAPIWCTFWSGLWQAAERMASLGRTRFTYFFNVDNHADRPDRHRLMAELHERRLAGVIFASAPMIPLEGPLAAGGATPWTRISLSGGGDQTAGVSLDYHAFFERAMAHLASRGSRRLAVISPMAHAADPGWLMARAEHAGLHLPAGGVLRVPQSSPATAEDVARLLMRLPTDERPDALIIADDHYAQHAVVGMLSGSVGPEALPAIVAHGNFPAAINGLPVTRLGFHTGDVLDAAMDLLKQGGRACRVAPKFEDELSIEERLIADAPALEHAEA